ncbi:Serine/threonine-protein kinase Chk2 [Labeo rohita]|uniref:Serine/threonine-protein kinase Chk2 n=1 Tax=Labeo rohita TaxID=84645 RepID=A0ABQ8MQ60_LABRO|nr:Serine/threonine-protein kinase Chk2 [Labeo rohita]
MSEEPGPSGQSQSHSQSQTQSQTQSQPGSSSSSAPTSSSQGSSSGSGTLSSVDTVPVQELQSIPEDEEEVQRQVWGRVIPLDENLVYVEDLSGNGTWVDDEKIGNGKQRLLSNNSVIALAEQKHQVFMFIDKMGDDQPNLPLEFSKKYHIARKIGTGVCGEVKLAIEKETCKKPCLIKTEDFYQTEDSYYIVLEYVEGGELFGRIKAKKQLEEEIAKLYFYQMLKAVEPENVLLASHDDICLIKITDFNQSKILEESSLMKTLCGTPTYLAPEVFTHAATVGYTKAVDYWSLGLCVYLYCQSLGGYPPFNTECSTMSVREQIINGHYRFIPSQWKKVSNEAKDLIKKLLVVDPEKRLSVEDALAHPWLNDDEMRNTANQLMQLQTSKKRKAEEGEGEPSSKRKPGP